MTAMQRRHVLHAVAFASVALSRVAAAGNVSPAPLSIGQYTSGERAYSTQSYWLEGRDGVVLVDTQFLPSDALAFADRASAATGKPAKLAVVLHPNPDKFNGCAALQARGIQVVTSRQVAALIPDVHAIRRGWFYDKYKPDYPSEAPAPSVYGDRTTSINAAGLELTLHVLGGPGCSGAHVVLQAGDALFVGDLLASKGHAWLELALFDDWLARLDELDALRARRIYVGRGPAGGPELIDAMRRYLRTVRDIVRAEHPAGELGMLKRWLLKRRITDAFAGYAWEEFVWEALPEVWNKLAAKA
jgi:glyoxylase-like metal-dependent hydrolase (beta-lactamase superfamily II)